MGEYDVVILPTFTQVDAFRKARASEDLPGVFSQVTTTFNAWVADLWELYGDGRTIVDSLQRQVIMRAAFRGASDDAGQMLDSPGGGLTASSGIMALAAECARDAAGVPEFEAALRDAGCGRLPEGLHLREAAFLGVIADYYELLYSAGFVEVGHAARWLAENAATVFPREVRILVGAGVPRTWIMRAFFAACPQLSVERASSDRLSSIEPPGFGIDLQFGFPSGRYAQPGLVADIVRAACAELSNAPQSGTEMGCVIACKDPLALYKQLEGQLAQCCRLAVQAQVPFASTDFGRHYLLMASAVSCDAFRAEDVSDVSRPPFSGLSAAEALQVDKELRANRLAARNECLAQLRVASDVFSQLEELASDPEADVLLGVFEQIAYTEKGRSAEWRCEQIAAANALRSCTAAARRVGASIECCTQVLKDVVIGVSFEGDAGLAPDAPRVLVTTQAVAAQMAAGSCAQVVLCDLTADDYPLSDKDDAAATLFAKVGLEQLEPALERARRTFASLLALPSRKVFLIRPLHDWEGNPTYPSAVLQELEDSIRAHHDAGQSGGGAGDFAHPASCGLRRGEELLFANAIGADASLVQAAWVEAAARWGDARDPRAAGTVALDRRASDGRVVAGFSPSPSQVESYLECPRKWFVQSRVGAEDLDEGFGPLERGSFAHSVLQRFYRTFGETVGPKVTPGTLAQARTLMREVAQATASEQYGMAPGSGRYVPVSQIEVREVESCIDQLVAYLDFEARLLPGFAPAYLEHGFSAEDGLMYAGHPFIGIVDRIDVDGNGNAVVIDYKGSITQAHQIQGKTDAVPGKVQARMYAQVVERALGLNVVGALYVSYGSRHACAGSFDARRLESAHLPAMRVEACSCAAESPPDLDSCGHGELSFHDMLDRTERVVERAIEAMACGFVAPNPVSADACAYCPAGFCPMRAS